MPKELPFYYCVVQDYSGEWAVCSFGGANKAEEKKFALNGYRKCVLVSLDHDDAQRRAALERQKPNDCLRPKEAKK